MVRHTRWFWVAAALLALAAGVIAKVLSLFLFGILFTTMHGSEERHS